MPVLIGSATDGHGVTRLLKAVRHEAPADRPHPRSGSGIDDTGPALAQVIRTIHTAHGGKLSLSRVLRGAFADGATVVNARRRGAHRRPGAADRPGGQYQVVREQFGARGEHHPVGVGLDGPVPDYPAAAEQPGVRQVDPFQPGRVHQGAQRRDVVHEVVLGLHEHHIGQVIERPCDLDAA